MRHLRKGKTLRFIAMSLAILLAVQVLLPLSSYALTSGPAQPEFSSFEPVATVKMVNEFTGDMTYNLPVIEIPGPEGSSYPLSLSYHSGASPEEDASWVGYGWTLNPGAIQRGKAGYPDDFKEVEVKEYNKVPDNWTASMGAYVTAPELFSNDILGGSMNASVRYNNYKGFGYTASIGFSHEGVGSLGFSLSDGDGSFSLRVNVGQILSKQKAKKGEAEAKREEEIREKADQLIGSARENKKKAGHKMSKVFNPAASSFGFALGSREMRATTVTPYIGASFNLALNFQPNFLPIPAGPEGGLQGSYSHQHNLQITRNAYGYLYSHEATEEDLMDYFVEREIQYDKYDKYLGTPFSNPDNFSATGEALVGGFRLHSKRVGHFHPNSATSVTTFANLQVEMMAGFNIGMGTDVGVGVQTLTVGEWDNFGYGFSEDDEDEPYFFRFTGDMGDEMEGGGAEARSASIDLLGVTTGPSLPLEMNDGKRVGRTAHIGYNLNSEMLETFAGTASNGLGTRPLYSYTKEDYLLDQGSPIANRAGSPDGIGEFAITNAGGVQYLYSLPVYSRNENNLSYLLRRVDGGDVESNYKVYGNYTKETANHYVGNEIAAAYASQYLLTEIRQPDYVDRTLDGPSDDDFGGWTKFTYEKVYGSETGSPDQWYKWRTPYNGLLYDRNEFTDNQDDVGTVSYGEKEMYYLEKIETRTHYAICSTSTRLDALDAKEDEGIASEDGTARGSHGQRKLDKIELYRKVDGVNDELIKTVNFQYDYSAWSTCGKLPNDNPADGEIGKLTLRRVWFDYEGTYNARISPYEFYYQYPRTGSPTVPATENSCTTYVGLTNLPGQYLTVDYPTKYGALENYQGYKDEIPPYDPMDIDAWGNYQLNGQDRYANFQSWMNQVPEVGSSGGGIRGFDPAAYQLKVIKFPTGGQIHIQYEQDDYQFVQDRPAMAMVHVSPGSGTQKYYLETVDDLGIPLNDTRMVEIRNMIQERFVDGKEKVYFKFLFSLVPGFDADLGNCISEFIDGYVTLTDVFYIGGSGNKIEVTVDNALGGYKTPEDVCGSLLRSSKAGKLRPLADCDASQDALSNNGSPMAIFQQLGAWLLTGGGALGCGDIEFDHSYMRIPIPKKLGGGLRVKRILMYDEGIEPDGSDKVLYGTEYDYTVDGKSSGVATKEPGPSRMEDPLVNMLDRYDQGIVDRVIAGKDKKQNEGPLGESLLPPPSVGYRRVVAKSIHSGKSSPGYTVSEFYTCKEFPFDKRYPGILNGQKSFFASPLQRHRLHIPELAGLIPITYSQDNRTLAQGFKFTLFDIHGEPRSIETYAGSYDDFSGTTNFNDPKLIFSQRMEYFMPGEALPMMDEVDHYMGSGWYPGKEMEIVTESRKIDDITVNGALEVDVSISILSLLPPIAVPMYTFGPNLNYSEHKLRTHTTTKVERYPAIQKAVTVFENGISHRTENIAFNPETGKPVLSRTTDSYHGLTLEQGSNPHNGYYHAYSIPASRHYPALSGKWSNERMLIEGNANFTIEKQEYAGRYFLELSDNSGGTSDEVCEKIDLLSPGSKVLVRHSGGTDGVYTIGEGNGGSIELLKSAFYAFGTTYSGDVNVLILESGKRNRLEETVGGFTTYNGIATVTTTASNATVNSSRTTTYADPLTAIVDDIGTVSPESLTVGGCVFDRAHSNDVAIRLTRMGSSPDYYLLIELVDWAGSASAVQCSEMIPNFTGGHFEIDDQTGELVFYSDGNECHPYRLPCLRFCESNYTRRSMDKVIVAGANTLADHWLYDAGAYNTPTYADPANAYETGEKGKWRVESNYKYRAPILGGADDDGTERTYNNAGIFDLDLFNYAHTVANDPTKWLCLSTTTKYSPFGMAQEEKDILGTHSNAHFGYKNTVPLLTAKNSHYDHCYFESFEMTYGSTEVEEGVPITSGSLKTDTVHAGKQSYQLNSELALRPFPHTLQTLNQGISIMAWVHDPSYGKAALKGELRHGNVAVPLNFVWEARSGLWNLYEAKIAPNGNWFGIVAGLPQAPVIVTPVIFKNNSLTCKIIVDDLRYQPLDANMTCFVYDPGTLKPVCSFDIQHFGTYSQYNGEGKLVRKLIETERGMRTVQESQYHSLNQERQ